MTLRGVYRLAVLGPFLGLAIAAWLVDASAQLPEGWDWVYPTSVTRGLLVYSILGAWLWRTVERRPMEEVGRLVWFVPLWYVGLSWALMFALALLQGRADELL